MVEHISGRHSTGSPVYDPSKLSVNTETRDEKPTKTHTIGSKAEMFLRIASIGIGVAVFFGVFGTVFPFFAGIGFGVYEINRSQVTAVTGWLIGLAGFLGGGFLALKLSVAASDKSLEHNLKRFKTHGRLSIPMMILGIIFAIVGLFLLVYGAFGIIVIGAFVVALGMLLGAGIVTGVAT